jgi:hypothetical protein
MSYIGRYVKLNCIELRILRTPLSLSIFLTFKGMVINKAWWVRYERSLKSAHHRLRDV